jgi:hypothetical protein
MKCGDYDITLCGAIIQIWKDETLVGWLPAMPGSIRFSPEGAEWDVLVSRLKDGEVSMLQMEDVVHPNDPPTIRAWARIGRYISPKGGWNTANARYHDATEAGLAELGEDVVLKPGDIDLTKAEVTKGNLPPGPTGQSIGGFPVFILSQEEWENQLAEASYDSAVEDVYGEEE